MTCAAIFAIDDVRHLHIIVTRMHFKSDLGVAYSAVEADTMDPVGENYWTHTCFFSPIIEYHVSEFCNGGRWQKQCEK
jgi:hypothetical protein